MKTWARLLTDYYKNLQPPPKLPAGIDWLYPQQDAKVRATVRVFLDKFFSDSNKRRLFLGINPGRFGAGVTGVNFTAARQLTDDCGIDHPFPKGTELSAEFIYDMIRAYGGPQAFYSRYFIGSVCPLGFVKDGKNINYYDDKALLETVEPFIIESIETQLSFPVHRDTCFCIGGEKNFKYLSALNARFNWFDTIHPLPHPRFIMQYRRKQKEQFIQHYLQLLA
ncbi:MAG: hypothetical protein JWP27_1376 [Flaviaesturariibacter sp.]|nr:hypothetical protein [Flaviaesturariibacter sp.]